MAEEHSRPNPDELLERIQAEEEQEKRGRLKIFLGYAAGVGKTFAMLDAARQRKKELDIVVGYVETHGRAETDALLEGLETVPLRQIEHGGVKLTEMDLDAVLARHPELALVDELAHTNALDSRHPKRYQDVEELLEAGIDVYTTLNVQHIESLRNVVAQITGVWIRETIPDSVIDKASEIELVDLPPEELLKRLKAGKVYIPEKIESATTNFFRKGNLTALRELSMRRAAERVDDQMRAYMETKAIRGPWPTAERVLVCISPDTPGTRLVRSARRLASQLNAEWSAIYVETPANVRLPSDQQDRLLNTLQLAERLGARAVTLQGHSVAAAVLEYAGANNVTKIVVGKTQRHGWGKLFGRSVVEDLIRRSEQIDVQVVTGRGEAEVREKPPRSRAFLNWQGYLQGLVVVILATALGQLISDFLSRPNMIVLYLVAVVVTAISWGLGPSILVSILSLIAFDIFFVPPILVYAIPDAQNIFTFIILLLVGVIISYLTTRIRRQTEAARRRERETAALYALGRDLAVSNDLESYIRAIIKKTKETFGHDTVIFLPDAIGKGILKPYADVSNIEVDEKELGAAYWSFQHQKIAGHGTDTLPNARARYLPMITARGGVGVLALWMPEDSSELTVEQERLLEAYSDLAAVAIENIELSEEAHNAQILRASEKLQTAFLNSISQDLRSPLVSAIGALDRLEKDEPVLDEATRRHLVEVSRKEVESLIHSITNLIDMSKIEAGAITISRQSFLVNQLIDAALEELTSVSTDRQVKVDIPEKLPPASVDFSLMVQTLANILDNAFKYSPRDSAVEVGARQVNHEIEISVADRGIGIPQSDLSRVFDKFYRVERPDNVIGTGLGLTICKGIVEAHGGRIWAENRPGGGTILKLTLPVVEGAA